MKKYEIYNNTNSNFIPEIPLNWKKLRVKNLVDKNTYYPVGDGDHGSIKPEMYLDEGVPYIRVQNLSWTGELLLDNVVYISVDVQKANSKSILRPGDILIAKTGATVGKLGLIPKELKEANTTSSVGKLTIDLTRFNPKYILYSFQAKHFNDQIWMQASQKSAQPGFNIDDLIEFEIASPELEEQTQIAAFLDYKTNLIDATIEKKKRLIVLLKEKRQAVINEAVTKGLNPNAPMNDSGVDWLGEIPEHWRLVPIRYLNNKIGSGVTPKGGGDVYVDEGVTFIRSQNVHFDGLRLDDVVRIDAEIHQKMNNSTVEFNDVLLNITGASIGRCCVVNVTEEMNVNQHVCIIRVNERIKPDFLNVVLQSNVGQTQIKLLTTGGNREGLTQEAVKNISIPLPNIDTQMKILNAISEKLKTFELINNKVQNAIEKLQTYRQSLISEAVTGKIDVRDWQPTKNK